ncbi:MAG: MATE family efflux transporter [Rubrivivax sp.]|nr:MATE family efflux transporter [Rubrivivax sp.]
MSRIGTSARRIVPLAWPVFVGQIAVLSYATLDTLLVSRVGAAELAALAVGGAAYITVFIGLNGVVLAISPIVGQLFGAQRHADAGCQVHQAVWIALVLAAIGSAVLLVPDPFLALAQTSAEVEAKVRGFLSVLALSLPASMLFTVFRGFNTAVSRPRAVMRLQLIGLAIKVPLSTALALGVPAWGFDGLGLQGCAIATAVAMWSQVLLAAWVLRHDSFYDRFVLWGRGLDRPDPAALRNILKLGVPLGASILVEVTGFAFMAFFIARLGTTPVAGHQIAANLVTLMFMLPLALGNATTTLVAQAIGAGDWRDARRLSWHGVLLGCGVAAVLGCVVLLLREPVLRLYTGNPAVFAAAMPLIAWLVVFHIADAAQIIAAFVLRAYKITTVPLLIYVAALWGVGQGGGYWLAFNVGGDVPVSLQGATGYWIASTAGLVLAALALTAFLAWVLKHKTRPVQTGN